MKLSGKILNFKILFFLLLSSVSSRFFASQQLQQVQRLVEMTKFLQDNSSAFSFKPMKPESLENLVVPLPKQKLAVAAPIIRGMRSFGERPTPTVLTAKNLTETSAVAKKQPIAKKPFNVEVKQTSQQLIIEQAKEPTVDLGSVSLEPVVLEVVDLGSSKGLPPLGKSVKTEVSPGLQEAVKINVLSLPVLQQTSHPWEEHVFFVDEGNKPVFTMKDVAVGEGGHCGYHALHNVKTLLELIMPDWTLTMPTAKLFLNSFQNYQRFMEFAAPIIFEYRKSKNVSWLYGNEIEQLKPKQEAFPILVIEHIPVEGLDFSEQILMTVKQFVQAANAALGIIWNNGYQSSTGTVEGAHWVGFVALKKENIVTLYCMDSMGALNEKSKATLQVIELLSKTPAQIDELNEQRRLKAEAMREAHAQDRSKMIRDVLSGVQYPEIFQKFLGCMELTDQSYPKNFTAVQLKQLGLDGSLVANLNKNWEKYLASKRPQALERIADKRLYGFWWNPATREMMAYDVSLASCEQMKANYQGSWLVGIENPSIITAADIELQKALLASMP